MYGEQFWAAVTAFIIGIGGPLVGFIIWYLKSRLTIAQQEARQKAIEVQQKTVIVDRREQAGNDFYNMVQAASQFAIEGQHKVEAAYAEKCLALANAQTTIAKYERQVADLQQEIAILKRGVKCDG